MQKQAWVVVLWQVDPDESVRERAYVCKGWRDSRDTFFLTPRDPLDQASPLILLCVVWAHSDDDAVSRARSERARLVLSGLWDRRRLLPNGAHGETRGLVALDAAPGGRE